MIEGEREASWEMRNEAAGGVFQGSAGGKSHAEGAEGGSVGWL